MNARRRVEEAARKVLAGNRRRGVAVWEQSDPPVTVTEKTYDFVCPSPSSYPFQWFWDSCFHAIALTHVDVALAEAELRTLFQGAGPDGFMPHMILWERQAHEQALLTYNLRLDGRPTSSIIQPPVLAQAVERVCLAGGNRAFLDEALPVITAYHSWLAACRDPDGSGLIAIVQPDESGMDASPKYAQLLQLDELSEAGLRQAMQRLFESRHQPRAEPALLPSAVSTGDHAGADGFTWTDCLVNACYLQALAAEARLLEAEGQQRRSAEVLARRARGLDTLIERCWDESKGAFFDYHTAVAPPSERQLVCMLTISSLLPLVLDDLPREIVARLVEEHLLNEAEFWLPYGVPSVAATEPSFDPTFGSRLLWRGPTWVNTNWFLIKGLETHGYLKVAAELTERTVAMLDLGGIRECYNPYTAEGYAAQDFGWSTLVLDLISGS